MPDAKVIIVKYNNHPIRQKEDRVLPVLSNQRYNSYLKEIADLPRISKNLTSHLARHTFATTIALDNGVPLETLSKMLGHSSTKTTQIYAKVREKSIKLGMANLFKNENKKNNKKGGKENA